jgi:hypothetical protein
MKTIGEFKSLFDLLQALPTEESCIEYLEKKLWNGTPVSPYDPTSKVYKRGDGMYRCKNTGKNFNIYIYYFLKITYLNNIPGSGLYILCCIDGGPILSTVLPSRIPD